MSSCANLIIGGKCVNEFNRATVLTISDAFIRSMKVILKGGFFSVPGHLLQLAAEKITCTGNLLA